MSNFHLKHRPKALGEVVGQDAAVALVRGMLESGLEKTVMFTGPSGCGKTTLARIMFKEAGCDDGDLEEYNAADDRGVDTVREIRKSFGYRPKFGKIRGILFDEAHKVTNDAQNALLKMLEDSPEWVYLAFATTSPQSMIPTLLNRCAQVNVGTVSIENLDRLVRRVVKKERLKVEESVVEKITECADGSPRAALVLLNQVAGVKGERARLDVVKFGEQARLAGVEIARALFRGARWPEVAKIIARVQDEPEGVRRIVLGYATNILLGKAVKLHGRAYLVIEHFRDNWYDAPKAGLVASCYAVTREKV